MSKTTFTTGLASRCHITNIYSYRWRIKKLFFWGGGIMIIYKMVKLNFNLFLYDTIVEIQESQIISLYYNRKYIYKIDVINLKYLKLLLTFKIQ